MPDNAADRKSIRRLEKQAATDLAQREAFVRTMMSTIEGRSWFWYHLSSCHVFATSFTSSPLATAFNEGQRSIGLALLAEVMSVCPDQYIQAQRESHERNATSEQRSRTQPDGRDSGRPAAGDGDEANRHDDYDPYRDDEGNPAFDGYNGAERG